MLQEIERLREAGVGNINIDLIAGLPHQDAQSWQFSLNEVIRTGVPHASVYMLEIDEDSRLGRELMAGGTKYHAHYVPDDDLTADLYQGACDSLSAAGVRQYEISNFSRQSYESRHNLKYWTRQPYFGVGVDAHSMLPTECGAAVRFSTPDVLEKYIAGDTLVPKLISAQAALEEAFFLGLRLNAGVDLGEISDEFGADAVSRFVGPITEMTSLGLLEHHGRRVCLTARGRLLSNEVFERFISQPELA